MIKCDGSKNDELVQGVTSAFIVPEFLEEMVCLVMDIVAFDNKGFRYF